MAEESEGLTARASRQWARVADYLLGRNALIGFASFMLLIISGYATWHGMRDFIIGVSATPTSQGPVLPGGMSISNDVLVIAVVVALTFLMWLMLRETFGAKRQLRERLITFPLYVFLAVWSIGFGYGFWWSLISGEEATRTGLAGLQEDARDASTIVAARLDAVRGQLDSVVSWSDSQMTREETSGGSCGTASGAGRGPLYNARRSVRDSINTLREGMTRSWFEPLQADINELKQSAANLGGTTVEERQRAFEARASDIRGRARNIAARSNQIGRSTAAEMRAIASAVTVAPGAAGFSCYDPTLAERLRQAAAQAEQPAELKLREAVFNEGPAGVANAVKNLWRNIGAYSVSLAGYLASGGKASGGRTDTGEPITGRDLIALLATIGIDLGLLALAILNPPREPPSIRPTGALRRQIKEAIDTAIARAGVDHEWVHRHFVHHNRASYFVIPNLYACELEQQGRVGAWACHEPTRRRAERSGAGALARSGHRAALVSPQEERAREVEEGGDLQERHRPDRRAQALVRGAEARPRQGRAPAPRPAGPQPRAVLQGRAGAGDRGLEPAGPRRCRDLPPGGRGRADAAADGAQRERLVGRAGDRCPPGCADELTRRRRKAE